jgi:hypothetical protein
MVIHYKQLQMLRVVKDLIDFIAWERVGLSTHTCIATVNHH